MTSKERPGEWLRRMAAQAGYDQASLARAVGVSRTSVTNWENGINTIGARNVPALSRAINRPQAEIIERFGVKMSGPLPEPTGEGSRMDSDEIVAAIRSLEATVQHLAAIQKGQTTAIEKMTRDLPTGLARALGLPKGQGVVVPRLRVRPEPDTQPAPATTDGRRRRRAGHGAADGNGTT